MQSEHLGTGSLLWQWDVNALFKPREPSTRWDLRVDGGTSSWWGVPGPSKDAFIQGSAHHTATEKPPGKGGQAAYTAASIRLATTRERPQPPAPTGEDSPPPNGRVQHPRDVCGAENQSPIVVVPHPCEQGKQALTQDTGRDQSEPVGRTSVAVCVLNWRCPRARPQPAPLGQESPAALPALAQAPGKGRRNLCNQGPEEMELRAASHIFLSPQED